MEKFSILLSVIAIGVATCATSIAAGPLADACAIRGSYGYVYDGVSYDNSGRVELAETGSFRTVDCDEGELCGQAKATFRFSNGMWVLLRLDFGDGAIQPDETDNCAGIVDFFATGTILGSNVGLTPGSQLFVDQPRRIAYTVSGALGKQVDLISISEGSVLSGTATRQPR